AAYIGHTPVRQTVLGVDADRRASTPEERERIRQIVREGLDAGAVGFATDMLESHVGEEGRPVASRLADRDELEGLAEDVAAVDKVYMTTRGPGWDIEEFGEVFRRLGVRATWSALLTGDPVIPYWQTLERSAAQ